MDGETTLLGAGEPGTDGDEVSDLLGRVAHEQSWASNVVESLGGGRYWVLAGLDG